ncbi:hypothetical protein [Antribacter gilvus]|uniref:hypothetical protein n=1 Tax=Antribacter gilvus TaxID=2304675 RepID=UPI000F7B0BAF|nr:hypothetical protein [Antribacter gilvus]
MTTTNPCASGCRIRDEHKTDCPGDECRGCLPRPANRGTLCDTCYLHLTTDLGDVPALMEHLGEVARLAMVASAKPLTTDPVHRGDAAAQTVLPAAYLAADELWSLVVSWAQVVLEEHPANLRGPNARPWHGDVVAWMLPHVEWIARQEWAKEMKRELARDVRTLRARWPMPEDRENDRPVPDVRCPRCDVVALRYFPPAHYRQPFAVACTECGRLFSEDEWERLVSLLARTERKSA